MTLVELLVVVGILMLLTVVLVPRLQPATEQRAVREAARSINTYLCAARNEAIASGRPVGVIFHRGYQREDPSSPGTLLDPEQPGVCVKLEQIELPEPFGGMSGDAVVRVQDWTWFPNPSGAGFYYDSNTACGPDYRYGKIVLKVLVRFDSGGGDITDFPNGVLRYGDQIQLGGKGPWYTIEPDGHGLNVSDFPVDPTTEYIQFSGIGAADSSGDGWVDTHWLSLTLEPGTLPRVPFPPAPRQANYDPSAPGGNWSSPLPFQIKPQPYLRSSVGFSFAALASAADALTLPKQAAVDLTFSGFDTTDRNFGPKADENTPIVVMFSPTGSVMGVYTHNPATPTDPNPPFEFIRNPEIIHFLVGQLNRATDDDDDLLPDGGEDQFYNVEEQNNFWVSINPQSGNVITTSVAASTTYPDTRLRTLANDADKNTYVRETRKLAGESRSMGGR